MITTIGRHKLQGRIGRGGMGSVYKAYDPILDRFIALKVIPADFDADDDMRARFFREAQAGAKLAHPNIVTVYDLGEADGYIFIAMELLEGEELGQLIARRAIGEVADKLSLIIQLCEGLEYAHLRGVVHRDIKPPNIFVLPDGHLKILDFGIARVTTSTASLTRRGELLGTLQYMAPERLRQQGDARADVFSVGVVLYELLTYRSPFAASDVLQLVERIKEYDPPAPSTLDPSLPAELDRIVARTLEKEPARRFESLTELRLALHAVRRRAVESADQARTELTAMIQDLKELQAAAAARLGSASHDEPVRISDRMPPHAVAALREDIATRTAHARATLARAIELEPVLARGLAALDRDDWDTAEVELERVVRELPEHARAAAGLADARQRHAAHEEPTKFPGHALEPRTEVPADPVASPPRTGHPAAASRDIAAPPVMTVGSGGRATASRRWAARQLLHGALSRATPVVTWHARRTRSVTIAAVVGLVLIGLGIAIARWPQADLQRETLETFEHSVGAARERAVALEAAALASARLADADARAATAKRLAAEGRTTAATDMYRQALEAYADAERHARLKQEDRAAADAGHDAMRAVKARASERSAEFGAALDRERRGDQMYAHLEFKAAAESFSEAASLYTKAAVPAPPAPPSPSADTAPRDDRAGVRIALQTYSRAIQAKDIVLLRQVRPGLSDDEVRRWVRSFEITRSRQVDLQINDIAVRENEAHVTGRRADVVVLHDGQRISTQTRFVYVLRRRADSWVLHELAETRVAPAARR